MCLEEYFGVSVDDIAMEESEYLSSSEAEIMGLYPKDDITKDVDVVIHESISDIDDY